MFDSGEVVITKYQVNFRPIQMEGFRHLSTAVREDVDVWVFTLLLIEGSFGYCVSGHVGIFGGKL